MDLILSVFAKERLPSLCDELLGAYDLLLTENDQDLYQWVIGQSEAPKRFAPILSEVQKILDRIDGTNRM